MSASKQLQFLKGSAVLVLSNMVIKGINFLLLPLYTKYLTPELLGVSDTITTLTSMLFPLLVMGLDSAFSAFYFDERTDLHQRKVFSSIWITLFFASIVPLLMAVGSKYLSILLFGSEEYILLIGIAMVSISLNLWFLPFSIYVRMENRMLLFAVINFTASVSMIVLNIIFLSVIQIGVYSLILSTACINVIQLVLYLKMGKILPKKTSFDSGLVKQMLKYSIPLIPNVVAVWILNMSDRYIILHYCGEWDVGLYGIAARCATVVSFIANGVYMAYTTYAYDKKDDEDAPKQYARILNAFTLVILMICFTGSIFAKEIVQIMTEASYLSSYVMIAPLLYSQLLYGINTIVGYAIGFVKKSKYILIATSMGAVLNVVLNIVLIPQFGAVAAAYTTCISFIIMTIITYMISQKLYYVKYRAGLLVATIGVTFAIAVGMQNMGILVKVLAWVLASGTVMLCYKDAMCDYLRIAKRLLTRGEKAK